jgi:hypothetical protein
MKKMFLGLAAVAVMTISLAAWAAEEQTTEKKDQTTAQPAQSRTSPSRRSSQISIPKNSVFARIFAVASPPHVVRPPAPAQEMYQNAQQRPLRSMKKPSRNWKTQKIAKVKMPPRQSLPSRK